MRNLFLPMTAIALVMLYSPTAFAEPGTPIISTDAQIDWGAVQIAGRGDKDKDKDEGGEEGEEGEDDDDDDEEEGGEEGGGYTDPDPEPDPEPESSPEPDPEPDAEPEPDHGDMPHGVDGRTGPSSISFCKTFGLDCDF